MQADHAIPILESLASAIRLDIWRLLVREGHQGLVAGEIAGRLGIAPTNLSFHLKALSQAGLLDAEQQGRYLRYRANIALMRDLLAFLTEECCSGQPGLCGLDLATANPVQPAPSS